MLYAASSGSGGEASGRQWASSGLPGAFNVHVVASQKVHAGRKDGWELR